MLTYIALGLSAVIIIIDQLIKYWAITYLTKVETIPIIKDILHLTYAENRGAAFSILENKRWLLIGVTMIMLSVLIVVLIMNVFKSKIAVFSFAMIIGGGIGNLVDRVFRTFVVDYVDFRAINFAIFNFADICVVCGTILLIAYIIFAKPETHNSEATVANIKAE